ncbi:uncharacterized protein LOC126481795 [Schistocerca serialis cubense]|uniref:uncharacterized protein LOC126481795 n=1 Tax=Schistocerca serialis cubense TaxID=2023355 RepID=UPI00214E5BBD|nr:uncharacterized protein LOC126481795 [Schistocerca serialis cubense]
MFQQPFSPCDLTSQPQFFKVKNEPILEIMPQFQCQSEVRCQPDSNLHGPEKTSMVPTWPPQHVPAQLLHPHTMPALQLQTTQLFMDILQPLRYDAAMPPAPHPIPAPVHLPHVFLTVSSIPATSVSTAPDALLHPFLPAILSLPPAPTVAPTAPPALVHNVSSTSAPGSFDWQTPVACSPVRTAPVSMVLESLLHPTVPPPAGAPATVPAYTMQLNSHVKTELSSCTPAACKSCSFVPINQISTATVCQSRGAYNPDLAPLYTATPPAPLILSQSPSTLSILNNGKPVTVSIHRVKPAWTLQEHSASDPDVRDTCPPSQESYHDLDGPTTPPLLLPPLHHTTWAGRPVVPPRWHSDYVLASVKLATATPKCCVCDFTMDKCFCDH